MATFRAKIHVKLDKSTLSLFRKQLFGVLVDEAGRAVKRMAESAVRYLTEFNREAGRDQIAESWRTTAPFRIGDTAVAAEVYSNLEGKTLYSISSATGSTYGQNGQRWPFPGDWLLHWLEYGTEGPYPITAIHGRPDSRGRKWLAYPRDPAEYGGADAEGAGGKQNHTMFSEGEDMDGFEVPEEHELMFRQQVSHPGIRASGFMQATRRIMLANLAGEANVTGRRVAASLR
jgi:hypothetical protein